MKNSKPTDFLYDLIAFDQTPVNGGRAGNVENEEEWENFEENGSSDGEGSDARSNPESESEADDFYHELIQSDLLHRSVMVTLRMENRYLVRELELGDLKLQNMADKTREIVEGTKKKRLELKQLQFERRRQERQKLKSERGELARIEAGIGQFWRMCEGEGEEEEGEGREERTEETFCDSFIQIMMGQNKTS